MAAGYSYLIDCEFVNVNEVVNSVFRSSRSEIPTIVLQLTALMMNEPDALTGC